MRLKFNVLHGILYRQVHENGIKKKNSRVIKASRNRVVSVKGVVKEKKSHVVRYQSGKQRTIGNEKNVRPSVVRFADHADRRCGAQQARGVGIS